MWLWGVWGVEPRMATKKKSPQPRAALTDEMATLEARNMSGSGSARGVRVMRTTHKAKTTQKKRKRKGGCANSRGCTVSRFPRAR